MCKIVFSLRNPTIVSALCCLVGFALSVISVLSIIGVAQMSNETSWTPRDSMQMFYQFLGAVVNHRRFNRGIFLWVNVVPGECCKGPYFR